MSSAAYRFLPWARRGLAAAIEEADDGQPLPQRAQFPAGLTVDGVGSAGVSLALYGPGDIIGLDPRTIIRTEPRPHTTDAEPNYLAAIEFDQPELPWMFSPAAPNAQGRLRPWIVLVVLETTGPRAVASPKVDRERPLPTITLDPDQAEQLPDLSQSWAWAHSQLTVDAQTDTLAALGGNPDLNLSRLICPRRLAPKTGYMACVVPAFDVGVARGLGGAPAPAVPAQPAWSAAAPGPITLPVFFHWDFATGPDGDFETLARLLKPYQAAATIGTTPMYVWDALPGLNDDASAADKAAPVRMEGALRASEGTPATLDQIPPAFQEAIRSEVDAPADLADDQPAGSTRAIAAPIYGGFHAKAARVPAGTPVWLRELNLDPRARAAAGLAADVVRANQEVFMQACWEQAGKVIEANALLNRARLAAEALARLHARLTRLPPADMLAIATPAKTRIPLDDLTLSARLERASMPDAVLSDPFRRAVSARRASVRLAGRLGNSAQPRVEIMQKLAPGNMSVDPNRFRPDGITGLRAFDDVLAELQGAVDLSRIGLKATIPADAAVALRRLMGQAPDPGRDLQMAATVRRLGLITERHVEAAQTLSAATPGALAVGAMLSGLVATAARSNRATAFLLDAAPPAAGAVATAIDVDASGRVLLRTPSSRADRVLATFEAGLTRGGVAALGKAILELPAGALEAPEMSGTMAIERATDGKLAVGSYVTLGRQRVFRKREVRGGRSIAVGPLDADSAIVGRFTQAFEHMRERQGRGTRVAEPALVAFNLERAAAIAAQRLEPRRTIAARAASMISLGAQAFEPGAIGHLLIPETVDRIMVAPDLPEPAYRRLAAYDREAFVPGIGAMPRNTLTLVETNPRFIEAYMIGLNHEMNRELLWRRYPSDQRGTPFRHFWDWEDEQPDIAPIHAFSRFSRLGQSTRGGADGGNLVLLVRGDLLRRYPNSTISAWKGEVIQGKTKLKPEPAAGERVAPAFYGQFDPDISFAGFDLTREDIIAAPGWFFVIEEQITEPRFGFDEKDVIPAHPSNWLDATWADTGAARGRHVDLGGRLAGHAAGVPLPVVYGQDAAHMAALALQRPFRLAVHAKYLMQP